MSIPHVPRNRFWTYLTDDRLNCRSCEFIDTVGCTNNYVVSGEWWAVSGECACIGLLWHWQAGYAIDRDDGAVAPALDRHDVPTPSLSSNGRDTSLGPPSIFSKKLFNIQRNSLFFFTHNFKLKIGLFLTWRRRK